MNIREIDSLLNQGDAVANPSLALRKGIRSGKSSDSSHFVDPPLHQIDYLNSALLACAVVTHNDQLEKVLNAANEGRGKPLTLRDDDHQAPRLMYCYRQSGDEVRVEVGDVFPALKRPNDPIITAAKPPTQGTNARVGKTLASAISDEQRIRGRVAQINDAMQHIKDKCLKRYQRQVDDEAVSVTDTKAAHDYRRRQVKILSHFNAGAEAPRVEITEGLGVFTESYTKHGKQISERGVAAMTASGSGFDDMCAVIAREESMSDYLFTAPAEILCHAMPYSAVSTLREKNLAGPMPFQVSANVVVVCPSRNCLVMQRKGNVAHPSHPHTGLIHTFGGGYLAPRNKAVNDLGRLLRTARREVFEESNLSLSHDLIGEPPPAIILKQDFLSFFQYAYLGWPISAAELDSRNTGNPEGGVEHIEFKDLPELLEQPDRWASAGAMAALMWLGLGAPGAPLDAKFGGASAPATDACDRVLATWQSYR